MIVRSCGSALLPCSKSNSKQQQIWQSTLCVVKGCVRVYIETCPFVREQDLFPEKQALFGWFMLTCVSAFQMATEWLYNWYSSLTGAIYIQLCPTQAGFLSPNAWTIRPNLSIPSFPLLYDTLRSLIMHFPHGALGGCRSMSTMLINHVRENSEQTSVNRKPWIKPPSVTATFTHSKPCCQNTAEP